MSEVDADGETLRRLADLRRTVAGEINGRSEDVGALRAALTAVISEVRIRDDAYVRGAIAQDVDEIAQDVDAIAQDVDAIAQDVDAIAQDVDAIARGEMPAPDGVLYGPVGASYLLDFYGSWERVAIGFKVPVNNRTGSGVPEYPALTPPPGPPAPR